MRSSERVTGPESVYLEQDALFAAWVNFDGTGTLSVKDSENVSSVTDNGTGDYTVNFVSAFRTSYGVCGAARYDNAANLGQPIFIMAVNGGAAPALGSCDVGGHGGVNTTATDNVYMSAAFINTTIEKLPVLTEAARVLHPKQLVGAWVHFTVSGGTPTVQNHKNVSSITDNGVGDFTLNFAKNLPHANYLAGGLGRCTGTGSVSANPSIHVTGGATTSSCRIHTGNYFDGANDPSDVTFVIAG